MTTTFYVCAALGWIVTLIVAYALGWAEGVNQGRLDGYDEASGECRRGCGMSADEIKALAQQAFVDGMANHHAGLLKTEARCRKYSAALLDFAAMVERCEEMRSDTLNGVINYIMNGATDEED